MENAVQICSRLRRALEGRSYRGEVTSVEAREIVVELPVGTMRVILGDALRPFSCKVEGVQPFHTIGIHPGSLVLADESLVTFPDTELEISLKLATNADLSVRAGGLFMPADLKSRLSYLGRALELSAGKGEFSEMLLNTGAGVPYGMDMRVRKLLKAMSSEDFPAIEEAAADCAGLGEGMIPASDMLLSGVMTAYTALGCALGRKEERVDAVNEAVFRGAAGNTAQEAVFQLALAAAGLADEETCQLFRCLFSDRSYPNLLSAAMLSVQQSGGDVVTGIGTGLAHCVI